MLLFLHGVAGALTRWRHQIRRFSGEYRLVALDFRGHGESEPSRGNYAFGEFLEDVRAVVEHRELPRRFVLVGHSFGGAVAAAYAGEEPRRVERLVLLATAGRIALLPWAPYLLKLPVPVLQAIRRFLPNRVHCSPAVLKQLIPRLIAWRGWELFPRIQAETLVIGGEWDRVARLEEVRRTAALIPHSSLEVIRHAGHLPQLERPARVNRLLERFLRPEEARSWRGPLEVPGEAG